ncbi:FMN-binding protein [Aquimarina brevivitae]|uniref:Na(+)-translocating NADH:ubiquinone oxidoreductase C subunit n=1 Tax=Aquimarina brevivitae TaxID=323412 RepID=A0A4Q7NUN6_9FLAO|nr:FMN-binding protein [Aquimarina brevivitae]RZS90568.1 Na(+)-translocating NADH:ubiquinone oxidoreductase C subunit [Aquimarina brevivitae]
MKKGLFIVGIIAVIICCKSNLKIAEKEKEQERRMAAKYIVTMVDASKKPSATKINTLITAKVIDISGKIRSITIQEALDSYVANTKNENPSQYAIFEIKNTSKVILPVYGKGLWDRIWGLVLLDKTSMKVEKIAFDHKSETKDLGANIVKPSFANQFIGTTVDLTKQSYTLLQDRYLNNTATQIVDGVSGATRTSRGVVAMLNEDLHKYKKYLCP